MSLFGQPAFTHSAGAPLQAEQKHTETRKTHSLLTEYKKVFPRRTFFFPLPDDSACADRRIAPLLPDPNRGMAAVLGIYQVQVLVSIWLTSVNSTSSSKKRNK